MWYLFLFLLLADIAGLIFLIRSVSAATLGPYATRLAAVLLAAYIFYFPPSFTQSAPFLAGHITEIGDRWVQRGVAAVFGVAIVYIVYQAWKNLHAEFSSILQAVFKFAAIGVLAIGARVLISLVF